MSASRKRTQQRRQRPRTAVLHKAAKMAIARQNCNNGQRNTPPLTTSAPIVWVVMVAKTVDQCAAVSGAIWLAGALRVHWVVNLPRNIHSRAGDCTGAGAGRSHDV
jgi:hypothetical protein